MTTAPVPAPSPLQRLWDRSLHRYPADPSRYMSLGIVVATTIVLYYQLYLSGGVATDILRNLHMSFTYYVNISVVGYLLGAAASVLAGLADRAMAAPTSSPPGWASSASCASSRFPTHTPSSRLR